VPEPEPRARAGRRRTTFRASGERSLHRIEVAPAGAAGFFVMVEGTYARKRTSTVLGSAA